jgi:hypothetical protein
MADESVDENCMFDDPFAFLQVGDGGNWVHGQAAGVIAVDIIKSHV